jgi:hypothetical protein
MSFSETHQRSSVTIQRPETASNRIATGPAPGPGRWHRPAPSPAAAPARSWPRPVRRPRRHPPRRHTSRTGAAGPRAAPRRRGAPAPTRPARPPPPPPGGRPGPPPAPRSPAPPGDGDWATGGNRQAGPPRRIAHRQPIRPAHQRDHERLRAGVPVAARPQQQQVGDHRHLDPTVDRADLRRHHLVGVLRHAGRQRHRPVQVDPGRGEPAQPLGPPD